MPNGLGCAAMELKEAHLYSKEPSSVRHPDIATHLFASIAGLGAVMLRVRHMTLSFPPPRAPYANPRIPGRFVLRRASLASLRSFGASPWVGGGQNDINRRLESLLSPGNIYRWKFHDL
jgi:hypothetical protein